VKPIVIIAISVVCSVGAVIAVQSFSGVDFSEVDVGESVRNIVPFDCVKAWDEWVSHPRFTDNDAFRKLSPEERKKIEGQYGRIFDEINANWCMKNHEEWQHRSADTDGRLAQIDRGDFPRINWNEAIADEYEYNEKFPDGAYQDFPR